MGTITLNPNGVVPSGGSGGGGGGGGGGELTNGSVINAYLADMSAGRLKGRPIGGGAGAPSDLTPEQAKTLLAIAIADVIGLADTLTASNNGVASALSATESLDTRVYNLENAPAPSTNLTDRSVTLAKHASFPTATLLGRNSAGSGVPSYLSPATIKAMLAITAADVSGASTSATVSAQITSAINALISGAPANLQTLDALASAIGDDPSFYSTVNSALQGKQPSATNLNSLSSSPTIQSFMLTLLGAASLSAYRTALGLSASDVSGVVSTTQLNDAVNDALDSIGNGIRRTSVLVDASPVTLAVGDMLLPAKAWVFPPSGTTIRVEESLNSGASWTTVGEYSSAKILDIYQSPGGLAPTDYRFTRISGGGTTTLIGVQSEMSSLGANTSRRWQESTVGATPVVMSLSNYLLPGVVWVLVGSNGCTIQVEESIDGGAYTVADTITSDKAYFLSKNASGGVPTSLRFTRTAGTATTSLVGVKD